MSDKSASAGNGASKPKAAKPPKPPKDRLRSLPVDVDAILGRPYDIETEALSAASTETLAWLAKQAAHQQLNDFIRASMKGNSKQPALSGESLKLAVEQWRPAIKRRGKSAIEKASKFLAGMTAAEKAELAAMLASQ